MGYNYNKKYTYEVDYSTCSFTHGQKLTNTVDATVASYSDQKIEKTDTHTSTVIVDLDPV